MKKENLINYTDMTEDQLFESHFDASQEIAHMTQHIIQLKRQIVKFVKVLDALDLEFERREMEQLKKDNKLN